MRLIIFFIFFASFELFGAATLQTSAQKKELNIGILAKRGEERTLKRWEPLADYLNTHQNMYHISIKPLDFEKLAQSVASNSVDFVITNTMYYVQLEHRYGVSRIATLVNGVTKDNYLVKEFGGVIFTRADNKDITTIKDIRGKTFGAVNARSFGGWIMAYDELKQHNIDKDDIKLHFFNTHDSVVHAVLNSKVRAGTVRTDTLERMSKEKLIDLSKIKILHQQKYENFPYMVSTNLYPEWPFAKLKHTSDSAANLLLSLLIQLSSTPHLETDLLLTRWTIPQDYNSVHELLKKYHLAPYDSQDITFKELIEKYSFYIYIIVIIVLFLALRYYYVLRDNKNLNVYNKRLDLEVKSRTKKLHKASMELQEAHQKIVSITNSALDAIIMIDDRGEVVFWNKMAEHMFGYSESEIMGRDFHQLVVSKQMYMQFRENFLQFIKTGRGPVIGKVFELEANNKEGEVFPVELSISALNVSNRWHAVGVVRDISERKNAEIALNRKLQKFIDTQNSIVILTDGKELNFANKTFLQFFGYESLGDFKKDYNCICDRFIEQKNFFHLGKVKENEAHWVESLLNLNGRQRIVSMLNNYSIPYAFLVSINIYDKNSYVVNFSDISDTMKEKLELAKEATIDNLTGIYNRSYFDKNISSILSSHGSKGIKSAIIFLDIDHFKEVNDTYGHDIGDYALKTVASLIYKTSRENDITIRWGGEEFIIICEVDTDEVIPKIAEHLRKVIADYTFEYIDSVTCSFGCAIHKRDENILDTIKRADKKLYLAKKNGRNRIEC